MIGKVYFIQAGSDGPIKIGFARCVNSRLSHIQCGNHEAVRLIGQLPCPEYSEVRLHSHFRGSRVRGEWFQPVPELLRIAELSGKITHAGNDLSRTERAELAKFLTPENCMAVAKGRSIVFNGEPD